jgi:hypothetical protein
MALDHRTVVLVARLAEVRVRAILLKGPALAERLYDEREPRNYADTDLLVDERDVARARATLRGLGYELVVSCRLGGVLVGHADMWSRGWHLVDLHVRLPGARTPPAEVWHAMSARTRPIMVGGRRIETLDDGAAALLLALHAAHHGPTAFARAREDLRRGVERFGAATWADAAALARRLGADGVAGWGLRLVPDGAGLANRLGLPATPTPTQYALAANGSALVTAGLEAIASASSVGAAVRILAVKLFPPGQVLQAYATGAGHPSPAVLWLRRAAVLVRHAPAGIGAFLRVGSKRSPRARRASRLSQHLLVRFAPRRS